MKKLWLSLLIMMGSFYTKAQSLRYFGSDNNEISKEKFDETLETGKFLRMPGDSINHTKLILREEKGKLADYAAFKKAIESQTRKKLSEISPTVFIYYPGKDPCNTSGAATPTSKRAWHEELQKGVWKLCETKPLYITKNINDMDSTGSSVLPWINDPEHIVEKTFFKQHYPCGSFVVIAPNGDYLSHFGEYAKDSVWKAVKQIKKQMDKTGDES